ncbi:MAG: ribonuclease H family protein [Clostridia bacterium]
MPKKIYCVKNGRKTGKFYTWEQCKAQVDGFTGAIYKSFTDENDADNYLDYKEQEHTSDDVAIAYVDGSFKESSAEFSCGAVILYGGTEICISKKYNDEKFVSMRNVAGEIMGAVEVLRYCIKNNIQNIDIYHDYEGVAKWPTNQWKANKSGTIAYKKFCDNCRDKISFKFVKVKAHSNNKYNDMADELAKKALGII